MRIREKSGLSSNTGRSGPSCSDGNEYLASQASITSNLVLSRCIKKVAEGG